MAQFSANWSAPIAAVAGTILVGQCLVADAAGLYYLGTDANRTTYGRCDGIAVTPGDSRNPVVMIHVGPVEATVTGLGAGLEGWVRISTAGILERVATPSGDDEIVGWCETTGKLHAMFGLLTVDMVTSEGAILPIDLTSEITGTLPVAHGGTGLTALGSSGQFLTTGSGVMQWSSMPTGTGVVSATGGVLNAAASPLVSIDDTAANEVVKIVSAAQPTVIRIRNYAGASTNGANFVSEKARGTLASPTKALSGDQLGGFSGRGWYEDGTPAFGPATASSARFFAEEDFTSTTNGTAYVMSLCRPGSTSVAERFRISGTGMVTVTASAMGTGSWGLFKAIGAGHTGQTASTEINDALFDGTTSLQFATGAITTQRQFLIKARTYRFVAASVITNAATHTVDAAPIAGTNATITNAYSYWAQSGMARFDGGITTTNLVVTGANPWVSRGTFASRPAAGQAGRLYMVTDGPLSFYDDGAAWQPISVHSMFTSTPAVAGFTTIQAGGRSTTVADSKGGILMALTNGVSGDDYRSIVKSTAGSSFTATAHLHPILQGANYSGAGIMIRASVDGMCQFFGVVWNGNVIQLMIRKETASNTSTSPTYTASTDLITLAAHPEVTLGDGVWLRLNDNATTRTYSYSLDGQNWITVTTQLDSTSGNTTPDQAGMWIAQVATAGTATQAIAFFDSWTLV